MSGFKDMVARDNFGVFLKKIVIPPHAGRDLFRGHQHDAVAISIHPPLAGRDR